MTEKSEIKKKEVFQLNKQALCLETDPALPKYQDSLTNLLEFSMKRAKKYSKIRNKIFKGPGQYICF